MSISLPVKQIDTVRTLRKNIVCRIAVILVYLHAPGDTRPAESTCNVISVRVGQRLAFIFIVVVQRNDMKSGKQLPMIIFSRAIKNGCGFGYFQVNSRNAAAG